MKQWWWPVFLLVPIWIIVEIFFVDSIDHETTIAFVGEPSAEQKSQIRKQHKLDHVAVGYKYEYFQVLWITSWTWDGEWCIYDPQVADPTKSKEVTSSKAAKHLEIERTALDKPFKYKFPPGVLCLGGLIVVFAAFKILWPEHRRVRRLFRDPRYRQAVTIIQKQTVKDSGASFVAAVEFLESQGIHRYVAEENLERLVGAIADHPNASQERSSHGA